MYDDSDIDAAVAAGRLTPSGAVAFRDFVASRRVDPPTLSERYFRYIWSIADVLPALAVLLVTGGVTAVLWPVLDRLVAVPVALLAWALSSRFARKRQALPMTMLCLICAVATAASVTAIVVGDNHRVTPVTGLMIAGASATGCWTYWRLYHLPLAVPLALIAGLSVGDHLMALAIVHPHPIVVTGWTFVVGGTMFMAAMWWDASDVYRQTARSDVAFWMHLLAAFLLCAAVVRGVAGTPSAPGWDGMFAVPQHMVPSSALVIILILTLFAGVVSLISNRRALLVLASIFSIEIGRRSGNPALFPSLVLGSGAALLVTTFAWLPLRAAAMRRLPLIWQAQLPRAGIGSIHRPID